MRFDGYNCFVPRQWLEVASIMFHFPDIDRMPEHPVLPIPDYAKLNAQFHDALRDSSNDILHYGENGHPVFGAYVGSHSNEMVTWGILASGEYLTNRDTSWISPTFRDFFSVPYKVWMNSPRAARTEHWYMFYVNALAGAVAETVYRNDLSIRGLMNQSALTLKALAQRLDYDFNQQGYRFDKGCTFTNKDIYRQPDSIGGYAYNMLYAYCHSHDKGFLNECIHASALYQAFSENPWYEIPNGSSALLAAVWLHAHAIQSNVQKTASWVFDHEHGPLQCGTWGNEAIDGLMMGWRGDTRELAMQSAYSMETLMPLQFILPSVRYAPDLADAVGRYALNVLANFQLFYAQGTRALYETRPGLTPSIPYERLDQYRDGHSPAACGDFCGHRSVYGAGYLYWLEALARPTNDPEIFAYDLSLTDWLAERKYPVFLLRNPYDVSKCVHFEPAPIWEKIHPGLFSAQKSKACIYCLDSLKPIDDSQIAIPAHSVILVAFLPENAKIDIVNGMAKFHHAELIFKG